MLIVRRDQKAKSMPKMRDVREISKSKAQTHSLVSEKNNPADSQGRFHQTQGNEPQVI